MPVEKNASALTVSQAHLLVGSVIPHRMVDAHWVLEVLQYWPQRNYSAYCSHRKRRTARLNQLK